ncbi:MAG: phospho-sugar mutase [Candidatus Nanopelagicales bacterium]
MSINGYLSARVQSWIQQDPDPATKSQLLDLLESAQSNQTDLLELQDAFLAPLEFGTAGLRGALGAGPNRMNRVTVLQVASGLAKFLVQQGFIGKKVVIGFDARYNSDVFAADTARVMSGAGLEPIVFPHVVPTPVLAFAIRHLDACAGVMVTASHNPPQDNGYKVYLGDGRQIVSPVDEQISKLIKTVTDVREISLGTAGAIVSQDVLKTYTSLTSQLITSGPTTDAQRKAVSSVYTALHGVGWKTLQSVFDASGFVEPIATPEQRDPDPAFPTVAFPNPEEKGALDIALALAKKNSVDVLLANDPDADRFAAAAPSATGEWITLRGDQIGSLLGWWMIERAKLTGSNVSGTLASSIVSSMMLESIANSAGLQYESTLTGFKWVSRVNNLAFGYEEALGYCVDPKNVSDKDGISAAEIFMEMLAYLKGEGKTFWQVLDELALTHGLHATDQVSVRVTSSEQVAVTMAGIRNSPPMKLGGLSVNRVDDLAMGLGELPKTDAVIIHLVGTDQIQKARVIVRPSGTEPKIKCYLEVVVRGDDLAIAQQTADNELKSLAADARPLLGGDS